MAKTQTDLRLGEKLEHANQLTSRHVYELDALTTEHDMTNKAYTHQEYTKCKLDMARTIA